MYSTIKKLSLMFIILNVFTFQSLMADMIFYYNSAILPSIIASKQQTAAPEAFFDNVVRSTIEPVTIDVLANDTIPEGSTITSVLLQNYDNSWIPQVDLYEGTWSVEANQSVTFTPNGDFSGGIVQIWYQITDQNGQPSTNWINLEYPVFVQAVHDEVTPASIEPINLDVLANDSIADGLNVTVLLEIYGQNGPEYVSTVETFDGNWTVEANQSVTFIPNENFGGGDAWIAYQIKDQHEHTSRNDIAIKYPQYVYAEQDHVQKDIIEQVTVDVLANDTIEGTLETLLLESYNPQTGEAEYVTNVDGYGGTWIVDGPTVMFIPEPNFGGGNVGIWYQITDDQGHVSQSWISIEFPMYVYANYDHVQANSVEAVNVNVLENDTIGDDVVPTVLLEIYGESGPEYVPTVETFDGTWVVEADQSVTFTPNVNFTGRYVHMEYQLSDGNGHMSKSGIDLEYPVVIYAEQDHVQKTIIEAVNIDVVANDTNSSPVTVEFDIFTSNGQEYVSSVEAFDGNWIVEADQSVTFAPNANFGGGAVDMWYQITDQELRTATGWIHIDYPVFVYAELDQLIVPVVEPVFVNVLQNDTNTSAVTIQLVNRNWDTGTEEIDTTITTNQGVWSVVNDVIEFEPNADTGGYVQIEYQITDGAGHMSRSFITISYPVSASPVCPVGVQTELVSLEEIVAAVSDNVGFKEDNGRRYFQTRLDTDMYMIGDDLFGSLAALETPLNPMYFVDYEDVDLGSYVRAELETGEIALYENNNTWGYQEERIENNNGIKSIQTGGETGDYSTDENSTNNLTIGGQSVFTFKAVHSISNSEMINMLEPAIGLTSNTDNTAQLIVTKTLETQYWWNNQSLDINTYASLEEYITFKAYDSSAVDLMEGVLYSQNGSKTIIFAEGSTGLSGTLVEVAYSGNVLLNEDAGTWSIETITDEGMTYDVVVLETTICGYQGGLYRLEGDLIIQGSFDELAGDIDAEIMFSEGLKDELKAFFIEDAILDVDPSTGI